VILVNPNINNNETTKPLTSVLCKKIRKGTFSMNKKSKKLLTLCLTLAMVLTMTVFSSAAFAAKRYDGADRYNTAIEIVKAGWEKADTAVITTGGNSADALCAAPLAKSYDAPLLLTQKGAADAKGNVAVIKELKDLEVKNVIIVGGTNAVSKSVEDEIAKFATVKRVSGADRYATSVEVAKALAAKTEKAPVEVAVANGADSAFADSLSISSIAAYKGMPILLTGKTALPKVVADYTKDLDLTKSYVIGGTAVVSDKVEKALENSTRLSGANRYSTNAAVLGAFEDVKYDKVYVATGEDFADALAGSALAAKTNSPIVLVGKKSVDPSTKKFVDAKVTGKTEVFVLGGEKAIPEAVIDELFGGALRLTSTKATGAKKIEVEFNKPVEKDKLTVSVKKGSVVANIKEVKLAENKKSAVLEMASSLTEGTYTVTVKYDDQELVGTVTVTDEKVAKVQFTSDVATIGRGDSKTITVGYEVLNQYGEDISDNESVNVSAGKGSVTNPVSGGTITLNYTAAPYVIGEKINVTIVHASSGTYASSVLTVGAPARVSEVAITSIYNPDKKELVNGGTENFYLVVEAKDQYGNKMEDPADVSQDVMVTVSNPTVADVAKSGTEPALIKEGNNKVTLKVQPYSGNGYTTGTSQVSLISKTTGNRAVFDVVVKSEVKVDTITLTAPSVFAAGDQNVEIPFTAVDQFGKPVVSDLEGKVTITKPQGFDIKFVKNYVTGKDKLVISDKRVTPTEGTIIIPVLSGTQKYANLTINVKKPAVPSVISGIKDFTKVYAKDASATMKDSNVIVIDQYGRDIDLDTYTIKATSSDASKVSIGGTDNGTIDAIGKVFDGKAKGSSTITLALYKGTEKVKNSDYTFTARTVVKDDIASYELAELKKVYEVSDTKLVVNGVLSDGSKVAVPTSYYTVVVNDSFVKYDAGKLTSKVGFAWGDNAEREVSFIVTVDAPNATPLVGKLVVSKVDPAIDKMELQDVDNIATVESDNTISVALANAKPEDPKTLAVQLIKFTDQYGKEIAVTPDMISNAIITNTTDGNELKDLKQGNSYTMTVVTTNNKVLAFKVIIK
jgi:putative cell wall-binding protein